VRDLTSRLRDIVRRDHGGGAAAQPLRELTYVPDTGGQAMDPSDAARALIEGCPCTSGCPSCVGPEGATGPRAKAVASRLLALIGSAPASADLEAAG
jgi:hypothetical protein